jgi:hypothetical protein
MSSNKLLAVLAAAGLTAAGMGAASTSEMTAAGETFESASSPALEAFLQEQPTSVIAPEAFNILASRFKAPGERGRPDIFGPPGPPEIGPPGQYSG